MEFTLLSEGITPEIAVLIRAALVAAVVFSLEALSNARRKVERKEVRASQPKRVKREQLSEKRPVGA